MAEPPAGLEPLAPLDCAPLLLPLHRELLSLLGEMHPVDWARRTVARLWSVKDVVAHLLDTDLRRLSFQRDGHPPPEPAEPERGLVAHLDRVNAEWVQATCRLSPQVLIDLLTWSGGRVAALLSELDPDGPALFGVAWAGEESSTHRFDVAREYTERWHHQQQIRDAVGARSLTAPEWLRPVFDTFVRALPHTYRAVESADGTALVLRIEGAAGGVWTLTREDGRWRLWSGAATRPAAEAALDQDTAWRLFTKGLEPDLAARRMRVTGDAALGAHVARMLCVMG
jgi:hypothetical protein